MHHLKYLLPAILIFSACGEETKATQPPCPADGTAWHIRIEWSAQHTPEWCRTNDTDYEFDLHFTDEAAAMGEESCEIEPSGEGCIVSCGAFMEWYMQLYSTFSGSGLQDGVFSFYGTSETPEEDICVGIGKAHTTKL